MRLTDVLCPVTPAALHTVSMLPFPLPPLLSRSSLLPMSLLVGERVMMTLWLYLRAIKATIQPGEHISTCIEGAPAHRSAPSLAPYKYKSDFQLNLFVVLVLCVLRSAKSGLNFNSALFSFWALWNMLNNQLLQLRDLSTFLMLLAVSHVCTSVRVYVCVCVLLLSCFLFLLKLPGLKFAIPMRKVLKSRSCPCVYVRVCACLMSPGETAYSVSANVLIISL